VCFRVRKDDLFSNRKEESFAFHLIPVEVTDFDKLKCIGLYYIAFERKKRLDAFYGFLGNSI